MMMGDVMMGWKPSRMMMMVNGCNFVGNFFKEETQMNE